MQGPTSRTRTHQWNEPQQLAEITRPMSGREYFESWSRGELSPPMADTLGFELADFGEGHIEITCEPDGFHYSPYGMVHGGLAATLLDSATGCAVQTRLPAGAGYATLNLTVSYLRPITPDTGTVHCIGNVVSMGRRVAVAEARVMDRSDRELARASATCILINPERTRSQ
ncbi:MAG: PaaI family thioesterase [Acidimicrobiia bacterium]